MAILSLKLAAALLSAVNLALAQSDTTTTATISITSTASFTPSPGGGCNGGNAYCAGGDIILRCESTALQPGNCADNLDEPVGGATCLDPATSTGTGGAAYCSALSAPTSSYPTSVSASTTTSGTPSTSSPAISPGATCTDSSYAMCAGGDIIFRCESSTIVAGNCADNLGEPTYGATCVGAAPTASCSALQAPSSSTSVTTTPPSTTSPAISPGATCTDSSYAMCAGGPIIFRCESSTIVAGNCADNLGEPMYGATCIGAAPTASCSALQAPSSSPSVTTTTAPPSTSSATGLSYGGTCTADGAAQCVYAPGSGNIILRCEGTTVIAGNCNDNLNEPEYGAVCIGSYPTAQCSANAAPSSSAVVTSSAPGATTSPTSAATTASGSASASVTPYTGAAAYIPAGSMVSWIVYGGGMTVAMVFGIGMIAL